MNVRTYDARYKDVKAVCLENDSLSVGLLPEQGAKMFSLFNKHTYREYMTQAATSSYQSLMFGGEYVKSEVSGFDDCFPTVDPCIYVDHPWAGTQIADHGEICQLQWDYAMHQSSIDMEVHGVRFPFVFRKSLYFRDERTLRIDYQAENCCAFDMKFIWTAHIMLNAQEGGRIILPYEQGDKAKVVFSFDEGLGRRGDIVEWPAVQRKDGSKQRFDVTTPRDENGNNYKLSFYNRIEKGEFIYRYTDGDSMTIRFPEQKIPYMNLWVNEGSAFDFHSVAPEPSTGSGDTPLAGEVSVLKSRSTYDWYLEFSI